MPYLGDDTVRANAERIVEAYAEGLDGLSNEDCQELAEDNIVTGEQCALLQVALRGGEGGVVTDKERQDLIASGLSANLVDAIRGDDGRRALQERAKWLGDVADGPSIFHDYKDAEALVELKLMGKEGVSELCRIISTRDITRTDASHFIFERAVQALSESADVTDPLVISTFIYALGYKGEAVRNLAVSALVKAGEPAVSKIVEAANKTRYEFDSNSRTEPVILRLTTLIKLLGDINSTSPTIDSALIGMISDRQLTPDIIRRVAHALVKRGSLAASAVALLLQDSDWRVRATAADILGRMGAVAAFAVPQLEKTLHDPKTDVKVNVISALLLIDRAVAKNAMAAPAFFKETSFFPPLEL